MDDEQCLCNGNTLIRPLAEYIGICPQGYSKELRQRVVDFGLEDSFSDSTQRLKLHHGINLSESTMRKITHEHAHEVNQIYANPSVVRVLRAKGADNIIAEADGCMIPIVDTDGISTQLSLLSNPNDNNALVEATTLNVSQQLSKKTPMDKRKNRKIFYREVRLCAAQKQGAAQIYYAATFEGVDRLGQSWAQATVEAGWASNSHIHVVGDGASWVADQCEQQFGRQGYFLVDFYHLSEYLANAAPSCCPSTSNPKQWLRENQQRLKENKVQSVIDLRQPHIEAPSVAEEKAPVRKAYRYITNREANFDYKNTLQNKLPIGSGLIESGHKHVLQKRLKITGASWKLDNAQSIAHFRVLRANGKWHEYWQQWQFKKAA